MRILLKIAAGLICLTSMAFAEPAQTLEKIVVKPAGGSNAGSYSKNNYSLQSIPGKEIEGRNLDSLPDALGYVPGVDLRYRGTSGVQGDLSLRGSTFEEVAVLIDGIKVMDPQTGHHNLDIPLTGFDIEKLEVLREGASSLYGAGAFAGSANFVVKKPVERSFKLESLAGEHALFGNAFSYTLPNDFVPGRVSFEHKISKAARPNTDFEYKTATLYLDKDIGDTGADLLFGYQKKDFGADSFYSNMFPEEEEHTETFFYKAGLEQKINSASLKNNLFLRKHRDKFILRRNNPASVNYHTTYVYGGSSQFDLPADFADLVFGMEAGSDEINSTNLGKHTRMHEAGSFGVVPKLGESLSADLRLRLDNYQDWGALESYSLGLGYLIQENLRLKGSLGHSFRAPSFTDLYYSDAANKGNPELKVEESDNLALGLESKHEIIDLGLEGFYRRGRNMIDWTRVSSGDPWQATNLGGVDYQGVEFSSLIKPGFKSRFASLDKVRFSYTYMRADRTASGFYSKYALDILKHQYIVEPYFKAFGFSLSFGLSYNQRYYGDIYFLGNACLARKIKCKDMTLEPFFKVDNFTDRKYCEISGVAQPGRWVKGGVKFEW